MEFDTLDAAHNDEVSTNRRIAILLSTPAFEKFFGEELGLTPKAYAETYRNDFSWYYASMFRRHGIDPLIYIPSRTSNESFSTTENVCVRLLKLKHWYGILAQLPIWRTPFGRYADQAFNALAFFSVLKSALIADRVDVLYIQEYWSGRFDLLSLLIPRRISIVGSDHGGYRDKNITLFKRFTFKRVAALTSQTQEEVQHVRRQGGGAVLCPNPIDTEYFSPMERFESKPKTKTILTVARLDNTQKRISDLIEATALLEEEWSLTIAGEGSDRSMLERLARDRGLSDRIRFIGFVGDRSQLRSLYWQCNVFCLPSAFEGLPMVVLEAMSCAGPVVVTDIPAYRDLIEPNVDAIVVPTRNPIALARGIELAYNQRDTLGRAARATILRSHSQVSFMKSFEYQVLKRCSSVTESAPLVAAEH